MKKNLYTAFALLIAVIFVFALAIPQGFAHGCDGSCTCGDCSCSQEDTCSSQIITKADAPTCGFNFGPANNGIAPFTVDFTNAGDKGLTVLWDFGDGASMTGETANHVYNTTGEFTVRQMIVDSKGFSCWVTETITVTAPTAEIPITSSTSVAPQSIGARNSADSASTDGDGSPVIVGNNNTVTITINPPCATETKTGLFNAFGESWKTFFQTLFGKK